MIRKYQLPNENLFLIFGQGEFPEVFNFKLLETYENIEKSKLMEVIVTDSIPIKNNLSSKIKVLSCAPLFADVMKMVHNHQSISSKFVI